MVIDAWGIYFVLFLSGLVCHLTISLHTFFDVSLLDESKRLDIFICFFFLKKKNLEHLPLLRVNKMCLTAFASNNDSLV